MIPVQLYLSISEKCGSDLCFEAKVKEIVVQIGKNKTDGTDDDVTVEFCGDVDASQVSFYNTLFYQFQVPP